MARGVVVRVERYAGHRRAIRYQIGHPVPPVALALEYCLEVFSVETSLPPDSPANIAAPESSADEAAHLIVRPGRRSCLPGHRFAGTRENRALNVAAIPTGQCAL